jgi:uncharacterized protein YxjI
MRYLIKQKIFSFGDSFTIKDEEGNDKFVVNGKAISMGKKLKIYDMYDQELIYIEQKLIAWMPEYNIYSNGNQIARVKKSFTLFKSNFVIESSMGNYEINGDFFAHNFNIQKNGIEVAAVDKKLMSFSDTYAVDISNDENHAFILALIIVIDEVLHNNNKNNA